jgi:hypothetical protein
VRTTVLKLIPLAMLALALHAPAAMAQSKPSVAERLHGNALASFREARFSEAYGRFIALADAGHAPAAELALWMYRHGPSVFGRDWDSSQEQLTAWAALAGQPAPVMVARAYPQGSTPASGRAR